MRVAPTVVLSDDERLKLERYSRGRSIAARLVLRAKIVLLAAQGMQNKDIATELGTSKKTVLLWRRRFVQQRIAGIEQDAPRAGRRPNAAVVKEILERTAHEKPPNGAPCWSTRSMAALVGVSKDTVQRIWKLHHIQSTLATPNQPTNNLPRLPHPEEATGSQAN